MNPRNTDPNGVAEGQNPKRQAEEALFQALLRKIPSINKTTELREVLGLSLKLMLRRPGDAELLQRLNADADHIIAAIKTGLGPEEHRVAMRNAARKSIELLRAAKEHRLPRSVSDPKPATHPSHAHHHGHAHAHHGHAAHHERHQPGIWKSAWTWATIAAVVVAIAGGSYVVMNLNKGDGPSGTELARQMENARVGQGASRHLFGGRLSVEGRDDEVTVVAERVPAAKCVSAAWELSKRGLVAINGLTLTKVTASKISEYCHSDISGATIAWTGKGARR